MDTTVNRTFKDTVFRRLFNDREVLLTLFNALNGTSYTDPSQVRIVTLEGALYVSMKNDISFILDTTLSLYEHQSTINPNLPLRYLFYVSRQLAGQIREKDMYASWSVRIPFPVFVTFYNGKEPQPENRTLKLSDLYEGEKRDPALELKIRVLNINGDLNRDLKEGCRTLKEYAIFTGMIREALISGIGLEKAVEMAVSTCIRKGILKDFLTKSRQEVTQMCIDEYNEELARQVLREDSLAEGREEGRKEGREEGRKEGREEGRKEGREEGRLLERVRFMIRQVRKGRDLETAADLLDLPEEELRPVYEAVLACAPDFAEERILALLMPERPQD